jgi:hypothetical protein
MKKKLDLKKMVQTFMQSASSVEDFLIHIEIQGAFDLANEILKQEDEFESCNDAAEFAAFVMDQSSFIPDVNDSAIEEVIKQHYRVELKQLMRKSKR